MTPEENNAIAMRFFDSAWNDGNLAVLDELTTPDTLDHSTVHGKTTTGTDSFKEIVTMFRGGFPDIHLTVEDAIYTSDRVVHRWMMRGTHKGAFMGIPATGKSVAFAGTTIVRMADGKLAERWANVDELSLLQQLGVVPPPPGG